MNFLFTTVLVLLLVAPGLYFSRTFYTGPSGVRYRNLTITDQVFRSVVPGLLLQASLIWFVNRWHPFGYSIHLAFLGNLMLGAKDDKTVQSAFGILQGNLGSTVLYETSLITLGGIGGWGAREVVRYFKWDRRTHLFRYDNDWDYLLTGQILEINKISFITVDALVKLEIGNVIYTGILADYELDPDGDLRTLYLFTAQRKVFDFASDNERNEEPFFPLIGDLLTIPYSQVLNLNITYFADERNAKIKSNDQIAVNSQNTHISPADPTDAPEWVI